MSRIDEIKARVAEYRAALASDEPDAGMRATLAKITIDSWAVGDLEYLLEELQSKNAFIDHIRTLNQCNTCGAQRGCPFSPGWGKSVRYNCPHWKPTGEGDQR